MKANFGIVLAYAALILTLALGFWAIVDGLVTK